jgi:ParB family chromosome partitioning protein
MEQIVELPITVLERGFYQPRDYFDPLAMESTKRSIQEKGQKYPVIVRAIGKANPLFDATWPDLHYELADGERRYRCCKELGFSTIKALVRDLTDEEMLDYTLTTNDSLPLNPIERANVFSRLAKEFGKSQAEIAKSFNLKQQQVSEYIRLLDLPKEVQDLTARAVISVRHARELLKINDQAHITYLALEVEKKSISTRELTKILKKDENKLEKKNESINISDISFEKSAEKQEMAQDMGLSSLIFKNTSPSMVAIEENRPERAQILGDSRSSHPFFGLLDGLNALFIPSKLYFRMELWLNMDLGSNDRPERWLSKLELSLLGGFLLACGAIFLPQALGVSLLAIFGTVLVYLFIF